MDTEQRIAAVRTRLRDVQTLEAAAGRAGRPCSDCIFGPLNSAHGNCDHIAHWDRQHDPVTGKWRGKVIVTTSEARSAEGLCGPEGLLFEPYSLPRKAARWLSRYGPFPLFYGALGLFGIGSSIAITLLGRW